MSQYTLIATSAFGMESIVSRELSQLGYKNLKIENGKVEFPGDEYDIIRCNLWLRTADRVLLKMAEFKALDFEELYQGTLSVPWESLIPENGKMHIVGKSINSKLFSVPDCQSIVKRAVVDVMSRKYRKNWFPENGPVYKIEISLLKDTAVLTVDTSGPGLHKRGYRESSGIAPLRETLAAALIQLSRWTPDRILADPFCGSGTIPIEAALIGRNIAPGLFRNFISEEWPSMPAKIWKNVREEATDAIKKTEMTIYASDIDGRVFQTARENASKMMLENVILFEKKPVEEFSSRKKYGCVITNPPFGERLGDRTDSEKLYHTLGELYTKLQTWSFFVLSPHPDFETHFNHKSDKNRKLYNGKIRCYLHHYLGPLPPRKKETDNM
ncbi:MAG TPA: class I SAM-dependent RNA methyltransferase [Spirochaetota bacterium]|nr:class I SAM-dependent RNA methyltransferase [Spirochaetota bacterium]